jgi:hypothetical protein
MLALRAGYTTEDHEKGWELWMVVMGQKATFDRDTTETPRSIPKSLAAINTLDAYDGNAFARTQAALETRFPAQLEFLLGGLAQGKGAEAVGVVSIFLDRYRALKDGTAPEREGIRERDQQAVALLEQRHIIDSESEAQLREYIEQAKNAPAEIEAEAIDPVTTPEYKQAAHDFHAWLKDWRAQARVVIDRRDYLISLGLASRRQSSDDEEIAETDAPLAASA